MNLYRLKMYIKSLFIIQKFLDKKNNNVIKLKQQALKEDGYNIISKIEDALSNKNILYFLDFGSLLGMFRDGSLIEYDTDIDYGIEISEIFTWKDLEDALNIQGIKLIKQFTVDNNITEQTYKYNNLTMDFFCHFNNGTKSYAYGFYRKQGYIYDSKYEHHIYKLCLAPVYKTKIVNIHDINLTIPEDTCTYLKSVYTDNWAKKNPNWTVNMNPNFSYIENKLAYVQYFF